MSEKLRLALRKGLIEDLADKFDEVYKRLAPSEAMLFNDEAIRHKFRAEVTFSATVILVSCGSVRIHRQQCADGVVESTRQHTDCALLKAADVPLPLSYCGRNWMLKGAPATPCGDDCGLCAVVQARHTASLALLQREMEGARRFVALRCLIRSPKTDREWAAYERGEVYAPTCRMLVRAHSCALLIDTSERLLYLNESQRVVPMVGDRVRELATALHLTMAVHPLARQWESLACGAFPHKWCMLFSEAMALALVRATHETTPDSYLTT
eukprot:5885169-Prymnesium_polylepis.1